MSRLNFTLIFAGWLLLPFPAIAQIIPDNTLVGSPSQVLPETINNLPSERISGGAVRGSNLFHSFQEFNVNSGRGAYFDNPQGITNIFSRVTGNNASNILGTLGVLGSANLFLINPKGIVFGPEARLDLRGSFFATTADSVVFDNGFEFSASNPQNPLLTVNIPVGLQFRENPGTIVNQSQVAAPSNQLGLNLVLPIFNNVGLAVEPGQTLGLIGGDIQLNGGNVTASSGQVILGSVASPGLVSFAPTPFGLSVNYENIQEFGNIQLQNSLLNTSGPGGGQVDIRGGDVIISGGGIYALTLGNIDGRGIELNAEKFRAEAGAQISTLALGAGAGGDVNIRATDAVEFIGIGLEDYIRLTSDYLNLGTINPFEPQIMRVSGTVGSGNAGNIAIESGTVRWENGVLSGSITLGQGNGGNITIRANTVEVVGSAISSGTLQGSTGQGGDITVEADRLRVNDGAVVVTLTRGEGASGDITITAAESVELARNLAGAAAPTLIATNAITGNGSAGAITIDTGRLIVSDGAGISSSSGIGVLSGDDSLLEGGPGSNLTIRATESVEVGGISDVEVAGRQYISYLAAQTTTSNPGGDIYISAPVVTVRDGGLISAASLRGGQAGNITIDAGTVAVTGTANNGELSSKIEASVGIVDILFNPNATGNAGSVNINANTLTVRDGATVTVQALGTGSAGNLNIAANSINLENLARLDGTTVSGSGANINLQARDILLRRQSRISSDAGDSDGGNITLNGEILLAFPGENSDITANARTARGGRVTLNVANIFGMAAVTREELRTRLGLSNEDFAVLSVNPTTLLETSDIAAISQAAGPQFQGTVTFSTSGVNPAEGLVELASNVVDPGVLIGANPCTAGEGSKFTITGKGGVAPSAEDVITSESTEYSWVEPAVTSGGVTGESGLPKTPDSDSEIVLARGWVRNARGEMMLVGYNRERRFGERRPQPSGICLPR
ncbi:MAG: hypothetical protein Fur0025_31070 [Oscillatoriaceae cyanobacterium]